MNRALAPRGRRRPGCWPRRLRQAWADLERPGPLFGADRNARQTPTSQRRAQDPHPATHDRPARPRCRSGAAARPPIPGTSKPDPHRAPDRALPDPYDHRRDEPFRAEGRRARLRGRAALRASPRRSARRSMSIPPPRWSGTTRCCATPCVAHAGAGRAPDRLRGEGQLQRRRCCDPGAPGRRRRHRLRGRDPPRPRRRHPARAHRLLRRRQDRRRTGLRPRRRRAPDQRRVRARAGPGRSRSPSAWARAPTIAIRVNPDVERRRPRQDLHRQGREQVRRRRSPRPSGLYARASNIAGVTPVGVACHIGSQITDLAPLRGRLRARCAAWSSACAARASRSSASTSAAAWACPTSTSPSRPRPPTTPP